MPITHVGSATGGGTSSTSKSCTIPTVAVNDLLLLFCVNKGSTAVPTVSDDDGGSWARMDGSGTNGCSIWYRRATLDKIYDVGCSSVAIFGQSDDPDPVADNHDWLINGARPFIAARGITL